MTVYTENGYADRKDYLTQLAEEHEVPRKEVFALADLLGPLEDFDGLVTSIEDWADMMREGEDDDPMGDWMGRNI